VSAAPFPAEYPDRRRRLLAELPGRKLDALLVSHLPNIRYLTGFTGTNAVLLLHPDRTLLLTDPRYRLQAAQESDCAVRIVKGPLLVAAVKSSRRLKLLRLGFESARFDWQAIENVKGHLCLGAALEPVSGLVEHLRTVKSPAEIGLIHRSVLTTSEAFRRAIRHARPGMPERDLAAELEYQMRLLGADRPAFETLVTCGPRTAFPHARSSSCPLTANGLLLVDMGASQNGYASDMTRMAFFGRPGPRAKRLHRAVLEAQLEALGVVRPGISAAAVDRRARRVLRDHGLDRAFHHSTGHGLGLEIHEAPRLGKGEKTRLAPGMVFTVEPGIYLEGFGGVRIEDTVLVTQTGCEVLTPTPKELLLL
jgi:Xaa-Pro aminopeptidase